MISRDCEDHLQCLSHSCHHFSDVQFSLPKGTVPFEALNVVMCPLLYGNHHLKCLTRLSFTRSDYFTSMNNYDYFPAKGIPKCHAKIHRYWMCLCFGQNQASSAMLHGVTGWAVQISTNSSTKCSSAINGTSLRL